MHTRTIFGIAASIIYMGGVLILRWPFQLQTLQTMPLNEFGDALAGFVGPVALLWLVIGYFQQGEELRQNGRALDLQATELKNAVDQHKEMVKATREQVLLNEKTLLHEQSQAIAENRPEFEFISCQVIKAGTEPRRRFTLRLDRGKAYYPELTSTLDTDTLGARVPDIVTKGNIMYLEWDPDYQPTEDIQFFLSYRDERSFLHRPIFTVRPHGPKTWEYLGMTFQE